MSVLSTLLVGIAGIVIGVVLDQIWWRYREKVIRFLMICVITISLGIGFGAYALLIYGSASPAHRLFAPDNPAMCWVVMVAGFVVALFFGFLLWKRSRKFLLKERQEKRERFRQNLDRAY